MKHFLLFLVIAFGLVAFEDSSADQYENIKPEFKCHHRKDKKGFCRRFPNIALRHNICNPQPTMLGHIEWCREDITITERDDCGNYETYEAVTITYRPVYSNGAWGKKFKRTYRKEPTLITPPVLAKGVVK